MFITAPGLLTSLYIAAQFPSVWASVVLAVLGCWCYLSRPTARTSWQADFIILAAAVSLILFIFCLQLVFADNTLKSTTFFHLLFYAYFFCIGARSPDTEQLSLSLVKLVTLANFTLLLVSILTIRDERLWVFVGGSWRFEAYFSEPARAACLYVFNAVLLATSGISRRDKWLYCCASLACLAATYSGSGLGLMALALCPLLLRRQAYYLLPAGILALLIWAQFDESFANQIIKRIQNIIELNPDNSTFQRFVSPWLALGVMFDDLKTAVLGMGIGGIESYIRLHSHKFEFLYVYWQGHIVPSFANGYIVILAWFGIPLGTAAVALWTGRILRSSSHPALKAYAVFYPVFAAWLFHPFFLLVYYLATTGKSDRSGDAS